MTILRTEVVDQAIDRRTGRFGRFLKEQIVVRGSVPLAMVRKRAVEHEGSCRAAVLLVHGFGQNRYAWHLPSRSFANHLAAAGFDVFNLDLRGQGKSRRFGAPRPASVDEYIEHDMPRAFEEVRQLSGQSTLFLVGHSLGGLLSYATAPLYPRIVRGVVTLGSPFRFTEGSGVLRALSSVVAGLDKLGLAPANVPVPIRLLGRTMHGLQKYLESPLYPIALRGWHAGAIEPEILGEHMAHAFDMANVPVMLTMFRWSKSAFGGTRRSKVDGLDYAERFERSTQPLLVIAGTGDDLAPPDSVEPAYLVSRASDKTYRELPLGHIDLLVGTEAPTTVWPMVERWLEARSSTPVVRRALAVGDDVP